MRFRYNSNYFTTISFHSTDDYSLHIYAQYRKGRVILRYYAKKYINGKCVGSLNTDRIVNVNKFINDKFFLNKNVQHVIKSLRTDSFGINNNKHKPSKLKKVMTKLEYSCKISLQRYEWRDRIIRDNELSKVDKLSLLAKHNLLPIMEKRAYPFQKYFEEFRKEVSRDYRPIEDYFEIYSSTDYVTIDLGKIVEEIQESDKSKVCIFTTSYNDCSKYITKEEFIDCIYEWCITNKAIGFII